MYSWLNIDTLLQCEDNQSQSQRNSFKKPQKRWGQSCVAAHNKVYIIGGYEGNFQTLSSSISYNLLIGQYLGDIWQFDFS